MVIVSPAPIEGMSIFKDEGVTFSENVISAVVFTDWLFEVFSKIILNEKVDHNVGGF